MPTMRAGKSALDCSKPMKKKKIIQLTVKDITFTVCMQTACCTTTVLHDVMEHGSSIQYPEISDSGDCNIYTKQNVDK